MANKKNASTTNNNDSVSIDELSQLRSIVFGAAEQKLLAQLATLKSEMEKAINSLEQRLENKISSFQNIVETKQLEIDKRIAFIDKSHDDNEANLQKSLDSLYAEQEMFASATQQDFKDLHQSLDNESSALTNNFDQQLIQLKTHLEEVSNELTSSKTDRKTLAKLLATMATNLEDDQL